MTKTTQQAREYAAQVNFDIAQAARLPDFGFASHVTDEAKAAYIQRELDLANDILAGKLDHNFTVWQRMNYCLTGECVALLPK